MLAQRISSINTISALCEKTGADIDEVATSVGMDPRIGDRYLKAGIGFGGSCFTKDVLGLVYLAETLGLEEVAEYWTQVLEVNEWQRNRFVRRVVRCLNGTLAGKKVTVLGYAFKENTNDTRESPALKCIKLLLEDAPREIGVFDPCCEPAVVRAEISRLIGGGVLGENGGPIEVYADAYKACADSNAVLIMTECDEFRNSGPTKSPHLHPAPSKSPSKGPLDPRPFQSLEPTESQILALHKFLSSSYQVFDPLRRYQDEPVCEATCDRCAVDMEKTVVLEGPKPIGNERLDWSRIAYHLQKPKWVFDGRGVLDISVMEGLGVRIESVGKVGSGRGGM